MSSRVTRREYVASLAAAPLAARIPFTGNHVALFVGATSAVLEAGEAKYRFTKSKGTWAFDSVWVRGRKTASPLSRADGFFLSGGEARRLEVVEDSSRRKAIRFTGIGRAEVNYSVEADTPLPRLSVSIAGADAPVCGWRTATASHDQHGAWATRGETGSDAEEREVFIDGSGRLVFGHSRAGDLDAAYVLQAELLENISQRGKSMQPSDTYFKSGRKPCTEGFFGYWQLRFGKDQPKQFGIVLDRDLGGRLHDVCERYYAPAVDSQVDLASIPSDYDPYMALDKMPLRLSCPESLIPNYGWHMEEYFPGYAKAAYPYGEDSGIQTAAFLAFEGHASGRDWEKYFGQYVMSQLPLWGEADGKGFFTRRPGGWTRWAYNTDYVTPFPLMEGGNWSDSEHIYRTAVLFGDVELKAKALELMRHDVLVKLDLQQMWFPPCWNPRTERLEDHRDDWETTAALGYCAEVSSEILFAETGDRQFLGVADRITDWLASQWGPEVRMNRLHPKVNTFHCFMGPLVRAMVHRYERSGEAKFLEIAQDLAWVMILTLCVTRSMDKAERPLTGVTCVGVRGCVDYDCTPNLCHEKDLPFLEITGALLPHVSGPAYAKFLTMQKLVLPRDSWQRAFRIQEQRDLNLRTNYDNYARGMANLAFALNRCSDPQIAVYERLVPVRDRSITTRREIVIANGTTTDRHARIEPRYLKSGEYHVHLDGRSVGTKSAAELGAGLDIDVAKNTTRRVQITNASLDHPVRGVARYDSSISYLSDIAEMGAQRAVGLPEPVFVKDRSFRGHAIAINGVTFNKGLGLAANTVILYRLDNHYRRFAALFAVDVNGASPAGPKASAYLTLFVDGKCQFNSGSTYADTPPQEIDIDVSGARLLVIRMSGNWDDNGDLTNDMANLANARLIGKAV